MSKNVLIANFKANIFIIIQFEQSNVIYFWHIINNYNFHNNNFIFPRHLRKNNKQFQHPSACESIVELLKLVYEQDKSCKMLRQRNSASRGKLPLWKDNFLQVKCFIKSLARPSNRPNCISLNCNKNYFDLRSLIIVDEAIELEGFKRFKINLMRVMWVENIFSCKMREVVSNDNNRRSTLIKTPFTIITPSN